MKSILLQSELVALHRLSMHLHCVLFIVIHRKEKLATELRPPSTKLLNSEEQIIFM